MVVEAVEVVNPETRPPETHFDRLQKRKLKSDDLFYFGKEYCE